MTIYENQHPNTHKHTRTPPNGQRFNKLYRGGVLYPVFIIYGFYYIRVIRFLLHPGHPCFYYIGVIRVLLYPGHPEEKHMFFEHYRCLWKLVLILPYYERTLDELLIEFELKPVHFWF